MIQKNALYNFKIKIILDLIMFFFNIFIIDIKCKNLKRKFILEQQKIILFNCFNLLLTQGTYLTPQIQYDISQKLFKNWYKATGSLFKNLYKLSCKITVLKQKILKAYISKGTFKIHTQSKSTQSNSRTAYRLRVRVSGNSDSKKLIINK